RAAARSARHRDPGGHHRRRARRTDYSARRPPGRGGNCRGAARRPVADAARAARTCGRGRRAAAGDAPRAAVRPLGRTGGLAAARRGSHRRHRARRLERSSGGCDRRCRVTSRDHALAASQRAACVRPRRPVADRRPRRGAGERRRHAAAPDGHAGASRGAARARGAARLAAVDAGAGDAARDTARDGVRTRNLRDAQAAADPRRDPADRRGSGGRGARRAADARDAGRHPWRSAHAHDVERRPRFGRGDGRRVPGARLRVSRHHRSLAALGGVAQSLGRKRRAAGGRDRAPARAVPGDRHPARLRGGHPRQRVARLSRSRPRTLRSRARVTARARRARTGAAARPLRQRDAASARGDDHASDEPAGAEPPGLRPRLRAAVRRGDRDQDARRERRIAGPPRSRRRSGAPGDRRRGDRVHRQRLSPRGDARAADGPRRVDGAARMGPGAPRAQHASARRGAPHHRGQAGTVTRGAALAVAIVAFAIYHATLLPGVDFGDTGSFQATVGTPLLRPRDAYPLYFAIGAAFVRVTHLEPAHALNLASAVEGAVAAGLLVFVGVELTGSILAGAAASLLFVTSYTFWSQAIIAEVYALHALFLGATLLLLLRWERRPTLGRLTAFFAVYALGFGNHLSMVLLLPGFTAFLLLAAPGGWRAMFAPRIVVLALACAAAGALQYAWNLRTLWFTAHPPHGLVDALQTFWFDVTKSDWRDTMVMRVPESTLTNRLAMYWFDLTQQFALVGPLLAVAGAAALWMRARRRAIL